ncbi:hypothetical protein ACFXCZ_35080, partial [Streptomyces sp. NPDC059396]|uniref:hypothetical protein n=1 Tax=Streptomyces sp. NPDC059396 TaxID=3346819 RepID=UPI00367CFCEB
TLSVFLTLQHHHTLARGPPPRPGRPARPPPPHPEIEARFKVTNKRKFDSFALSPQSPDLDPSKVQADIDKLRDAVLTTRTYTNKVVAHRQYMTTKISLAWADLDIALNTVGEVLKRYYTLRHPPIIKGNLTPELPLGWERPYQAAWSPSNYTPPEAKPLDTYVHPPPQPGS